MNLWKQEPALKGTPLSPVPGWAAKGWTGTGSGSGTAPTSTFFNQGLIQSLGYLNISYGTPSSSSKGDPQYPFPWMNWSYRPFNNVYELLLVPTVSSSRLLARNTTFQRRYYGYMDSATRSADRNSVVISLSPFMTGRPRQVPYPHLLNFFESGRSSQAGLPRNCTVCLPTWACRRDSPTPSFK